MKRFSLCLSLVLILILANFQPILAADYSLIANPSFSINLLPTSAKVWYQRLLTTFNSPSVYPNPDISAASRNTYSLGRTLNSHFAALITALRATHDPAIVAEIDRLLEKARAGLADVQPECTKFNHCTEQADGFLNWAWLNDPNVFLYGGDTHTMDEMLTHANIASATYVLYQNRNLSPTYNQHYQFWIDYLQNHFEARWRARSNKPTQTTFINDNLTHPYIQFARFGWYMYKMTGDTKYLDDFNARKRIAQEKIFVTRTLPSGNAFVWDHRMPWSYNSSGAIINTNTASLGCQSTEYAVYTFAAALDLGLDGADFFKDQATQQAFARTMSELILPASASTTVLFRPDVCGGITVPGEGFASTTITDPTRDFLTRSKIWTHVGQGIWDNTGKIKQLYQNLYPLVEPNTDKPQGVFIPSFLLAMEVNNNPLPSPSPSLSPKAGDANNDNKIDGVDYIIWLNHFNQNIAGVSNGNFNNDSKVDGLDYVIWLNNFGK